MTQAGQAPLLEVAGLSVEFPQNRSWIRTVRDATLTVPEATTVGLVGESGSGKSVTSMAILGLIGMLGGRVSGGTVKFQGADLLASHAAASQLRGNRIGVIFQQPSRSLNPAFTVGDHIAETVRRHLGLSRREAWRRAVSLLDRVGIARAAERASDYPHQFSGGMCQRVMIAMAISCEPKLLIADEPTTALDVTVQARVLALLNELAREGRMAMLFISHDMSVVSEVCQRVVVMYAGETVESGTTEAVFTRPEHPYTRGLLASIPAVGRQRQFQLIEGSIPAPDAQISGCRFHERCSNRIAGVCDSVEMKLAAVGNSHLSRCARSRARELA